VESEIDELAVENLEAVIGGVVSHSHGMEGGAPGTGNSWQLNPFVQGFLAAGGTFPTIH
jgi:hypothetical protein